ncbi:helix-turn-helix transcriptional regulator [Carboxylicivirga sediminis]|uniref:Helix-turn-helix transcriptional regulator n=1 Tax=Carboxylicivirga sediminis TaxID=2006564 RepID=A0A941F0G6_9BACT|nr:AraC family transcriptional regulator [Carboxylicivirga sediminis]MBR8534079.1 helix-turn-helix transcriptional regulator [Carboxylicivirga sediminis]
MKPTPLTLSFKEGAFDNYIKALYEHFGGKYKDNHYHFRNTKTQIHAAIQYIADGIEIGIMDAIHYEPILLERVPDGNPDYLHLIIIHTGEFSQSYNNQHQHLEADSAKGIFFYNGMFPLVAEFPANMPYRSIAYKFKKEALKHLIPEALPQISKMYQTQGGLAYHIPTTSEVNQLVDDIFHYHKGGFGTSALIKARAIEAFAITLKVMEQMDDDELNGLHIDDYNRLMRIKKHLQESFAGTINVEAIAEEFAISISKLNRDFKALFNTTIYKFYTHAKMDEAYRRLQSGQYSVTEVGYDLGYNSLSKFSEMFKKVKGISPSDVVAL